LKNVTRLWLAAIAITRHHDMLDSLDGLKTRSRIKIKLQESAIKNVDSKLGTNIAVKMPITPLTNYRTCSERLKEC
jgi:hypothetical protein